MADFVKQKQKRRQTLESAQYGLEIIFKSRISTLSWFYLHISWVYLYIAIVCFEWSKWRNGNIKIIYVQFKLCSGEKKLLKERTVFALLLSRQANYFTLVTYDACFFKFYCNVMN